MATSTVDTLLMHKANADATEYTKLVDIIEYPDLGGTPGQIDITTLSDHIKKSIEGILELDSLELPANYDSDDYDKIAELKGKEIPFAIYFGLNGEYGIFEFTGMISVMINGAGVNEARKMMMTITVSSEITKKAKASA